MNRTLDNAEEVIGCTGHRPQKLGGFTRAAFLRLFDVALGYLNHLPAKRYVAISGMALGWDMAFARVCCVAGIPFVAAVPFVGQEKTWPEQSQRAYRSILRQALDVVVVSEGAYSPQKMQIRNELVVDHSSRMVALWDGSDGGTANCLKYAAQKQRPVINLWDEWRRTV